MQEQLTVKKPVDIIKALFTMEYPADEDFDVTDSKGFQKVSDEEIKKIETTHATSRREMWLYKKLPSLQLIDTWTYYNTDDRYTYNTNTAPWKAQELILDSYTGYSDVRFRWVVAQAPTEPFSPFLENSSCNCYG